MYYAVEQSQHEMKIYMQKVKTKSIS